MIKAVLFDIDGVLIDTTEANRRFLNDQLKEHEKKGLSKKEYQKVKFMTIKQVIEKYCPELKEEETEELRKKWSSNYKKYLDYTKISSGAKEILEFFKGKIKLGVATNRSKTSILVHHKIIDFFDVIVTSSDVKTPKPSPEGIQKALKELKVKPEEAIFIGDTIVDIQAGEKAGVKMLLYKIKIDETEVIEDFSELKNFL